MTRGAWAGVIVLASVCACEESKPPPPAPAVTASSAAQPSFDIEGFCDKTMAIADKCEGDDELLEGNKIGLCVTTLRTARDDEGARFDQKLADKCIGVVKAAKPPLPRIRTLKTLAVRFPECHTFLSGVPFLAKFKHRAPGTIKSGEPCKKTRDCSYGLYCPLSRGEQSAACRPKKKAGEACDGNDDCIGRCSRSGGKKCVSYCGSG